MTLEPAAGPATPGAATEPDLSERVRDWRTRAVRELLGLLAAVCALLTLGYLPFARDMRPIGIILPAASAVVYALGARLGRLTYRARATLLVAPNVATALAVFAARGLDPIAIGHTFASSVLATLAAGPLVGAIVATGLALAMTLVAVTGPLAGPLPDLPVAVLAYLHVLGVIPLLAICVHGVAMVLHRLGGVSLDSVALVERLRREAEERRRADLVHRETEERFRLAFQVTPDALAISRVADSTLIALNAGFESTFGYPASASIGRRALELGFWAKPEERTQLIELMRVHGHVHDREAHIRHAEGSVRTVLVSSALFRALDGSEHMLSLFRDVTETRRLEIERKRLHEQFAQAQKIEAVGRLAGGVAHEFNNLLTSFGASAGFIGMEAGPGTELASIATELEAGVERGTQLTRQLLAFTQRQVLRPRPVDVNALLGDLRRVLERVLGEGVVVVLEPSRESARVLGDPGQLQQVLLNLVVNARDAMPRGGRILLATSVRHGHGGHGHEARDPGEVVIEVVDEGPGIPPEVAEHLFEPFFSTKADGTGLGLASVYGIVKQHRGTVEVDPGVGRGATFRIRLPAVAEVDPADVSMPGLPPRGHGQEVLLVDDEAVVRRSTERLLTRLGYHVTVASSGEEALALVEGGAKVGVVVTDIAMPGMNGNELARQIRDRRPGTPVLFVSGYAEELLEPGLPLGGKLGFLPKPFSMEVLAEKIRELLAEG